MDTLLDFGFIRNSPDHRYLAGPTRRDALRDQPPRVDQEPGTHPLLQVVFLEMPHLLPEPGQVPGQCLRNAALVLDDVRLQFQWRVAELGFVRKR